MGGLIMGGLTCVFAAHDCDYYEHRYDVVQYIFFHT